MEQNLRDILSMTWKMDMESSPTLQAGYAINLKETGKMEKNLEKVSYISTMEQNTSDIFTTTQCKDIA